MNGNYTMSDYAINRMYECGFSPEDVYAALLSVIVAARGALYKPESVNLTLAKYLSLFISS